MKTKLMVTIITVLVLGSLTFASASGATITLSKQSYTVGETVTISFKDATGDKDAWFAIYPAGTDAYKSYPEDSKSWIYANTNTETPGASALAEGTITLKTEGLTPGEYRCTYFPNVSYTVGNTITFNIVEEAKTNPQTGDGFTLLPIALIFTTGLILLKRKEAA